MKCPCCGGAELVHETRNLDYSYKGMTTQLPDMTGNYCPACGEGLFDRVEGQRLPTRFPLDRPRKPGAIARSEG